MWNRFLTGGARVGVALSVAGGIAGLRFAERAEEWASIEEFVLAPHVEDPPVFHHHDSIRELDRAESMCNDDRGAVYCKFLQRFAYLPL